MHALRVELYWSDVAPALEQQQASPSFEATNPAAYNWSLYDWLLAKAQELKWPVLLTVTSPVPQWASANHTSLGSPNAKDFEEFMTAVGSHYGSEVSLFAIWNEPNDIASLQPQFNASGPPVSPRIYRGLFQAGYAGLQAAGIAHPKVLMGETAPVGFDSLSRSEVRKYGLLHDVAPLAFLRGALCLNSHYKKAGSCESLPAYGYSTHAYTQKQGPLWVPPEHDDVTIGTLSRLESALNLAAHAGAISGGHADLPHRVRGAEQAQSATRACRPPSRPNTTRSPNTSPGKTRAWRPSRSTCCTTTPPAGLRGRASTAAPSASRRAWSTSAAPQAALLGVADPAGGLQAGHGFSLWGLVRPATGPTKVTILVKTRGRARSTACCKTATTESLGYWSFASTAAGVDLESALDQPHRRQVRRAADRGRPPAP